MFFFVFVSLRFTPRRFTTSFIDSRLFCVQLYADYVPRLRRTSEPSVQVRGTRKTSRKLSDVLSIEDDDLISEGRSISRLVGRIGIDFIEGLYSIL